MSYFYCFIKRSAPQKKFYQSVLARKYGIEGATISYINDILVDESRVSFDAVIEHLRKYGLITNDPEPLNGNGGTALGLKLTIKDSN